MHTNIFRLYMQVELVNDCIYALELFDWRRNKSHIEGYSYSYKKNNTKNRVRTCSECCNVSLLVKYKHKSIILQCTHSEQSPHVWAEKSAN